MAKLVVLIIDPDLSTRALVEASVDPELVELVMAKTVASAREVVADTEAALIFLDEALDGADVFALEAEGAQIVWLGTPESPAAQVATAVMSKPIDIVSMQLTLEEHLGLTPSLSEPVVVISDDPTSKLRAVEAERDALLAEVEILRHKNEETRRLAAGARQPSQPDTTDHVTALKTKLADAMSSLDVQRRTALALQNAYGEVEQAHGNLLQQHEALQAERDALAERSREVSTLREQLEVARRDKARDKETLEVRLAAASAPPRPGPLSEPQRDGVDTHTGAGWWHEAVTDAIE